MMVATGAIAYLAYKTGSQTDKLISAANSIADSMGQTVAQSKKAFDATVALNQLDERAWVNTSYMRVVSMEVNGPMTTEVGIINGGKTVAQNVRARYWMNVTPRILTEPAFTPNEFDSGITVVPNISYPIPIRSNDRYGQDILTALREGRYRVYLYGEIKYKDVFKVEHTTHYCAWWNGTQGGFKSCGFYNDAN